MLSLYINLPIGPQIDDLFKYGTQENALGNLVTRSVDLLLIISTILALLFLLIGGIAWITSGGDKTKVEEARNRITHSIVGLVIIFAIWGVWVLIIKRFLGVNITGGVNL